MPLDQHIEERHGEGETSVEICPAPVHHLLQVAHNCQHRQDCLDEHALLLRAALTQFEVGRIPLGRMEGGIAQDDHALLKQPNEPLKGVVDVSTTILSSRHFLLDSWGITYLLC